MVGREYLLQLFSWEREIGWEGNCLYRRHGWWYGAKELEYGCLIEDKGITFCASYLIDPKGVLRQITMNDLPVGRSVDEALRLVQAFQFTMSGPVLLCGFCGFVVGMEWY
jgi:hypothetical protein